MKTITLAWWSAGITSAIACKIAIETYPNTRLIYIETGAAHPDNVRFKIDCENWYGREIETVVNSKGYKNPIDVILKTKYVNGPEGARCTLELKKEVRREVQDSYAASLFNQDAPIIQQVFGFEYVRKEVNRAIRFKQQFPETNPKFPLIKKGVNKDNCAGLILQAGIQLPVMYKLGYPNNNCIGCVKGGMGYWNKIRNDFPTDFNNMASAERVVGHSCINGTFLDELLPEQGIEPRIVMPSCSSFCDIELADLEDVSLDSIMNNPELIEL